MSRFPVGCGPLWLLQRGRLMPPPLVQCGAMKANERATRPAEPGRARHSHHPRVLSTNFYFSTRVPWNSYISCYTSSELESCALLGDEYINHTKWHPFTRRSTANTSKLLPSPRNGREKFTVRDADYSQNCFLLPDFALWPKFICEVTIHTLPVVKIF